jgi:putative ABC transport system permease protein
MDHPATRDVQPIALSCRHCPTVPCEEREGGDEEADSVFRLIRIDLARRRLRTVLAATGIAVGVAAVVALFALGAAIERSAAGLAELGGAEFGLFQSGRGDLAASRLPQSLADSARDEPGVEDAAPILVLTEQLPDESTFLMFGVDPESFVMSRLVFTSGGPPRAEDEVVLGDGAADDLGLTAGDTLRVGSGEFRIVGVYSSGLPFEDQGAALPLDAAQDIVGSGTDATTIAVSVAPGAASDDVAERLEQAFPGTVAVSDPGQVERLDTNALLVDKATVVLTALALLLGAIMVMNTTLMTVLERQSEFALLVAVGWPGWQIARLVIGQALLLGLLGASLGLPLGLLAAELAPRLLGVSALVDPSVSIGALALALGVALSTGVLGSLYPAWRVTRLQPAAALG